MRSVLLDEAEKEFWASVDYYEKQEPGLGVRFKLEVDQFIAKIQADPMQPRLRRECYRRVNLSVFRHYIAYVIRVDLVFVVAICHAHRRPEFWIQRITGR
jgi:plasmid stabilization system protein ParE